MRRPFLAGNWKMHLSVSESVKLAQDIKTQAAGVSDRTIMVAPNFTALAAVGEAIKGSNIALGCQNMHHEEKGAFTGEVSPLMLLAVGVKYVILGHSERRAIFGETDELINKKVKSALAHQLLPVLCVGETLAEREQGRMEAVVRTQLQGSLAGIAKGDMARVTIAYEPVWAIGTGKTATPQDADAAHAFIRTVLTTMYDAATAQATVIQYGGSVKDSNVDGLMAMPNIDGALVGGAALEAASFARIVKFQK